MPRDDLLQRLAIEMRQVATRTPPLGPVRLFQFRPLGPPVSNRLFQFRPLGPPVSNRLFCLGILGLLVFNRLFCLVILGLLVFNRQNIFAWRFSSRLETGGPRGWFHGWRFRRWRGHPGHTPASVMLQPPGPPVSNRLGRLPVGNRQSQEPQRHWERNAATPGTAGFQPARKTAGWKPAVPGIAASLGA